MEQPNQPEIPEPPASPEPPPGDAPPPGPLAPTQDERTMAMLAHLIALAGYVLPFGNVIGPLVVWLVRKDTSPFVDDQGRESLNFQITVTLALLVCIPLAFVCIGIVLMAAIGVASLVLVILAAVAANRGQTYRYPMTLRLIK